MGIYNLKDDEYVEAKGVVIEWETNNPKNVRTHLVKPIVKKRN